MNKALQISVVLKAIDQLTGPARGAFRAIENIERAAKGARSLRTMGDDLNRIGAGLQRFGAYTGGAGLGLAHVLGLTAVPGQAIAAEFALRSMGNVAQLTNAQLTQASNRTRDMSRAANQTQADLIRGLQILTAKGLDFNAALSLLPAIGKTATAETSDIEDLANASFAVVSNLTVAQSEMRQVFEVMAQAGKAGSFEIRDMAREFPNLTAGAHALGMKGVPAVASLGAALQIAMKGAGSTDEAANNLKNFLDGIASPEAVRNLAKFGVNVKREVEGAIAGGEDPIAHMVNVLQRVTGGDAFKLGEIFGDRQVKNFIRPMLANMEEYERIKRQSLTANGVVDQDFDNMMTTALMRGKQLQINLAAIVGPALAGPLSAVSSILQVINGNPALQRLAIYATGTLLSVSALSFGMGTLLRVGGSVMRNVGALRVGFSALRAGWLTVAAALEGGPTILAAISGGLTVATASTKAWAVALLANPLTGLVAVLAGALYLLYRNWGETALFWREAGQSMYDAGANLVTSLWAGMKSVANRPVEQMLSIVERIRRYLPYSPAKEGPLRDIHRIRLVETIAATLRPEPLVRAMHAVTLAAAVAAPLPLTSLPGRSASSNWTTGSAKASDKGTTFILSPTIQVVRGVSDTPQSIEKQVLSAIRKMAGEIERILQNERDLRQRIQFNDNLR